MGRTFDERFGRRWARFLFWGDDVCIEVVKWGGLVQDWCA